jgi:hypothetical protein
MDQLHNAGHHVLEYHKWDGPDHFALHGAPLVAGDDLEPLLLTIMEIENPERFPDALDQVMAQALNEPFPVPIVAVTLQFEAFTTIARGGNLTDDQKWALEQRKVRERADAQEVARVVTVGVGGDVHVMERSRATDELIHVSAELSDDLVGANSHGEMLQRKLMDIAAVLPFVYTDTVAEIAQALREGR